MAVSATFVADFSSFNQAVDGAEVKLREFSSGIGRVDKDLAKFGDQFSGVRLIQDARLMVEAVERVGGISKLTEDELARLTTTVDAASEKMRALGQEVPPEFTKITDSTTRMNAAFEEMDATYIQVDSTTTKFTSNLNAFDRTLAALGINIGPQIQAIRELGDAAGGTANQIGLVGKAGLAVSAGLAGWQLGRMIAEYFKLDDAIANNVAALLGWGDVASETAAAKIQTLSRATVTAGREITSMTEAVRINAEEAKRLADAHTAAADAAKAAWERAGEELKAFHDEQRDFRQSLVGMDAIDTANQYLVAIQNLRDQGLEPLKSKHDEIVAVMERAKEAMEALGMTGTQTYRDMIAVIDQFNAKVLESFRVPGAANAITGPGAVLPGNASGQVALAESESWAAQLVEDVKALDEEVEKYHQLQGAVHRDAASGANAASQAVSGWEGAVTRLGGALTDAAARAAALAMTMTQSDWLQGKPAGMSVTDYLNTPGPEIQRLRAGGSPFTVNVSANNSFFNATSEQELGRRVGDAVMARLR